VPAADFFAKFGFFVCQDLLDPETCSRIRSEMAAAPSALATVVERTGPQEAVDEATRRTKSAKISEATKNNMIERLSGLRPSLETHFNVTLQKCQQPQFLVYRAGDFFKAHEDNSLDPEAPDYVKDRKVSVVLFLNSESETESEGYSGGSLTFYGLLNDDKGKGLGFPLIGRAGLLVAFRSETLHGVTSVVNGKRYSVVSWFV
jgi:predicted 2-oxoglutarate/Fe(II)-dependent dioxygenase YbiX